LKPSNPTNNPQIFCREIHSQKGLNEVDGEEKYRVETSNSFAALEDFSAKGDRELVKLLEKISKFQSKRIQDIMN
jgi:hypothetical protein